MDANTYHALSPQEQRIVDEWLRAEGFEVERIVSYRYEGETEDLPDEDLVSPHTVEFRILPPGPITAYRGNIVTHTKSVRVKNPPPVI